MRALVDFIKKDIERSTNNLQRTVTKREQQFIRGEIAGLHSIVWAIENSTSFRWDDEQPDIITRFAKQQQDTGTETATP
jgi:hypothetical protein